jgi:cysteine desulfurase
MKSSSPAARVYLDHNATTPLDPRVLEEMLPWLRDEHGNASSIHSWGIAARTAVERARRTIARAINARPEEIIFTSGGTEANNIAIRGFAMAAFQAGQPLRLLTSNADHPAVRETVQSVAALLGFEAVELPVDGEGRLAPEVVEGACSDGPCLAATLAANNEVGTINDIKAIIARTRPKAPSISHVDAVQALGRIPIDVGRWGCDSAAFSAHKLYGPKGVGALYRRSGVRLLPLLTGGGQEGKLRAGSENVAGIVGFGAAVRLAVEDLDAESRRLSALRDRMWEMIHHRIPQSIRNTPVAGALPGTLNVSFPGQDGRALVRMLDERGFAISAASACSSSGSTVSHVLRAITDDEARQRGAIRISLGRSTTSEALDGFVEALEAVVAAGRD